MDMNRLTQKSQEALHDAQTKALRFGHTEVDGEHLLLALLDQPDGLVPRLLEQAGADPERLRGASSKPSCARRPTVTRPGRRARARCSSPSASRRLLDAAEREAKRLKDEYVSVEHLVIALLDEGSATAAGRVCWTQQGLTRDTFLDGADRDPRQPAGDLGDAEVAYEALEKYGRDLVAEARTGKLDPVIGRDTEIRRVIQILSRKTKNNPVLIGDPGVGKTAIVEGLAQRIVRGDVPGGSARQDGLRPRHGLARRRREVPRRVRGAAEGRAQRGRRRPRAASCCSSTSCTPSSAPARPRARWTPATCSSRCSPAASCT